MITRNNLLRSMFIYANYGGEIRVAPCEALILFYLFYHQKCTNAILQKLLPTRTRRSLKRYTEGLEAQGYIKTSTLSDNEGRPRKLLSITDRGSMYCLRWLNDSEDVLELGKSTNSPLDQNEPQA